MIRIATTVGAVVLVVAVWATLVAVVTATFATPSFVPSERGWLRLWLEFGPFIITLVMAGLMRRWFGLRIPRARKPAVSWFGGVLLGAGWIGSIIGVLFVVDAITIGQGSVLEGEEVPVRLVAVGLNAVTQEMLVHGLVWAVIAARHGRVPALIGTTAVFVVLHADAFETGLIAVLAVVAAGAVLGLLTGWFGGVEAAIGAYFAWNAVGGLLFGAVQLSDRISLLNTRLQSALLAGEPPVGVESGLIAVLVSTGLAVFLWLRVRRSIVK